MDRPYLPRPLNRAPVGVLLAALAIIGFPLEAGAIGQPRYVDFTASSGSFLLAAGGRTAILILDPGDWRGVARAAADLQADIRRVTDLSLELRTNLPSSSPAIVIIGTIGRSAMVDRLGREGRIDLAPLTGKWESFLVQTVADPFPGVSTALVIAGSDKRGTIYGFYDLSEQIGVSPWYWWADIVPDRREALYVRRGRNLRGEPSVKYHGIFLNDERRNLDYWVRKHYGERQVPRTASANFNSAFYARIFEVILRLKGHYLWPAMWNNAFVEDDPDNPGWRTNRAS